MIAAVTALFLVIVASLHAMTGDLATTGTIVLLWLAAGLALSLLMARAR